MTMEYRVTLTGRANSIAARCLLGHYNRGCEQEDLCFAIWHPSQGRHTYTALIHEIILPKECDRMLMGNVHLLPEFLHRAQARAMEQGGGLALMHSHPTCGWQEMSGPDIVTERDRIAHCVGCTHLPLVGLTIGRDNAWSARFWKDSNGNMERHDCARVNVVGEKFDVTFNPHIHAPFERRPHFMRTLDTWGESSQKKLAKIKFGVIGLGSVGCLVAESLARMGVQNITLIDCDRVETHNLDRLIYAACRDIGKRKVDFFAKQLKRSATARQFKAHPVPHKINHIPGFLAALDCDILFCCVDKPVGRHHANHIAYSHLIPVFEGGILTGDESGDMNPHWKTHVVQPDVACLRCRGQYTDERLSDENAGILGNRAYDGKKEVDIRENANVFPFSANLASSQVLQMLRQVVAPNYWDFIPRTTFQYIDDNMIRERREDDGKVRKDIAQCNPDCDFPEMVGKGKKPPGLLSPPPKQWNPTKVWSRVRDIIRCWNG